MGQVCPEGLLRGQLPCYRSVTVCVHGVAGCGWVACVVCSLWVGQVWLADGLVHGVRHAKGDRKRTWEVLRDESLHSYVLTSNPVYKKALSGRAPTMVMSRGKRVPPVEAV